MKIRMALLTTILAFGAPSALAAEESPEEQTTRDQTDVQVDLETEPVAYILRGAGLTAGVQLDRWRIVAEGFHAHMPAFLHGNDGFEASNVGGELHVAWFSEGPAGWFVGPEFGLTRLSVTHRASETTEHRWEYSAGLRGGYRWYPGLGNLYLNPHGGISYTLNAEDVEMAGETFENGAITPFATIGIGWSFGR